MVIMLVILLIADQSSSNARSAVDSTHIAAEYAGYAGYLDDAPLARAAI